MKSKVFAGILSLSLSFSFLSIFLSFLANPRTASSSASAFIHMIIRTLNKQQQQLDSFVQISFVLIFSLLLLLLYKLVYSYYYYNYLRTFSSHNLSNCLPFFPLLSRSLSIYTCIHLALLVVAAHSNRLVRW